MSVHEAIAWAIRVSKGEPMPARMLLIVGLASRCGDRDNGFVVWPSVGQIADDTDMSQTSVRRWMRHLEEQKLVERFTHTRENGASSSNRYRLPIRSVFYHPTKGAMEAVPPSQSDRGDPSRSEGAPLHSCGRGPLPPGGRGSEGQYEEQYEESGHRQSEEDELDLGLPPVPPKDPTPSDVAAFVAEEWAKRETLTPLRGGSLSEANAEKARDLGKKYAVGDETAIDAWREIFARIDASDWLQGKGRPSDDRPPFKLSVSFILEKRNFEKVLQGRYDGKSSGAGRTGTTSAATSGVIERLRSGQQRGEPRRDLALPDRR